MTPSTPNQPAPAKPEHSALYLPLKVKDTLNGPSIRDANGDRIAEAYNEREADELVRAVNNHTALVAALEETREACDAMAFIWDDSRFPAEMRKEYAAQFVNLLFPAIRNSRAAIRNATK